MRNFVYFLSVLLIGWCALAHGEPMQDLKGYSFVRPNARLVITLVNGERVKGQIKTVACDHVDVKWHDLIRTIPYTHICEIQKPSIGKGLKHSAKLMALGIMCFGECGAL